MKKNSKKPEIRRKELIEVASRLFMEKGYESVSVRDILDVVGGAPGMFYYYFKSKQEIYLAAIDQYLTERLNRRCRILEDDTIAFEEKKEVYASLVKDDIIGYMNRFKPNDKLSISDDSYRLWAFVQMLNRMSGPHAKYIMQGVREGKVSGDLGITEENVNAFSLYSLYGAWGLFQNGKFADGKCNDGQMDYEVNDVFDIIHKIFYRNV